MKRQYTDFLKEYLGKKIILITGPRQAGKTTQSGFLSQSYQYLNYDDETDRKLLAEKAWDRKLDLIVFDELHKMKNWKSWIKGIFDKEGIPPSLVVTGSARLDIFKKLGDSLAGRYFQYRIHPLDVRELKRIGQTDSTRSITDKILNYSGFPEPYLEGSQKFYNLWKKTHLDIILRQDLIELFDVKSIKSIEILINLLKHKVGSPISYSSLAQDLQVSDKTVKSWLQILENMYVIFKVTPFHENIGRANLKRPKYYFYDVARVEGDLGAKLENLVACSLLKECHFRQDCLGEEWELSYLSLRGGAEIDFAITKDNDAKYLVEVKTSDDSPSKNFKLFRSELPYAHQIQLVYNLKQEKTYPDGLEIRNLDSWLVSW